MTVPGRQDNFPNVDDFLSMLGGEAPFAVRVVGSPPVYLFKSPGGGRIGLYTPYEGMIPISPYKEVILTSALHDGRQMLEISCAARARFADFYVLLQSVSDRIQGAKESPSEAVLVALREWRELLAMRRGLPPKTEIGLLGELLVLEAFIRLHGVDPALASWRGPDREEHDFGLRHVDVEVKATVREKRLHVISSLTQLVASPNRDLWVLSLMLTPGGAGESARSLPDVIQGLRDHLSAFPSQASARLDAALLACGWRDDMRDLHQDRYSPRANPMIALVDDDFPRLTPDMMEKLGHQGRRITEAEYTIDLTGIGYEEGSTYFAEVLQIGETDRLQQTTKHTQHNSGSWAINLVTYRICSS